ncbi:hypothetical protein Tco_0235889 [Tanacetum coccineum]
MERRLPSRTITTWDLLKKDKTVPSFKELRTKTSTAFDNRSSRSNYNGARNNNGKNQQLILRIALPSPYSQVTLTSSPHLSVMNPLPLAINKDSQELWDSLRGLSDNVQEISPTKDNKEEVEVEKAAEES